MQTAEPVTPRPADGPVGERYLAGVLDVPAPLITEIAWPVTATS
jgi:hypothetical protein